MFDMINQLGAKQLGTQTLQGRGMSSGLNSALNVQRLKKRGKQLNTAIATYQKESSELDTALTQGADDETFNDALISQEEAEYNAAQYGLTTAATKYEKALKKFGKKNPELSKIRESASSEGSFLGAKSGVVKQGYKYGQEKKEYLAAMEGIDLASIEKEGIEYESQNQAYQNALTGFSAYSPNVSEATTELQKERESFAKEKEYNTDFIQRSQNLNLQGTFDERYDQLANFGEGLEYMGKENSYFAGKKLMQMQETGGDSNLTGLGFDRRNLDLSQYDVGYDEAGRIDYIKSKPKSYLALKSKSSDKRTENYGEYSDYEAYYDDSNNLISETMYAPVQVKSDVYTRGRYYYKWDVAPVKKATYDGGKLTNITKKGVYKIDSESGSNSSGDAFSWNKFALFDSAVVNFAEGKLSTRKVYSPSRVSTEQIYKLNNNGSPQIDTRWDSYKIQQKEVFDYTTGQGTRWEYGEGKKISNYGNIINLKDAMKTGNYKTQQEAIWAMTPVKQKQRNISGLTKISKINKKNYLKDFMMF